METTSLPNSKVECRWLGCKEPGPFLSVDMLVDHVNDHHLVQFREADFVVCLWQGCKVFNRPFEKKDWLPQHMRRHTKERPHKCFMNGCNMSFWSVHALQNHLQLHFKPSPKKTSKPSVGCHVAPHSDFPLPPLAKRVCSGSNNGGDSAQSDDNGSECRKKQSLALKVCIPFHSSNVRLSGVDAGNQIPIPVNGSIVRDDDIDLSTLSVIKRVLLNHLLGVPQCGKAVNVEANNIYLKGKVIGRRKVRGLAEEEYLVRWSPMITPDSWIPSSDYTGNRALAINSLLHCQKSALVQRKVLTTEEQSQPGFKCGSRKRKRTQ